MKKQIISIVVLLFLLIGIIGLIDALPKCVAQAGNVAINCGSSNSNCEFDLLSTNFYNISVSYTSTINKSNALVWLYFCEEGSNCTTDQNGRISKIITIQAINNVADFKCTSSTATNCLSKPTKSVGKYYLKAIVDPNNANVIGSRDITLKNTLKISKLTCAVNNGGKGFINQPTTCEIEVIDVSKKTAISGGGFAYTTKIGKDGSITELSHEINKFSFTSTEITSIPIEVTVTKDNYISGTTSTIVVFDDPTSYRKQYLYIDDKQLSEYTSGLVPSSKTPKTIKLVFKEVDGSETPISESDFKVSMNPPSGCKDSNSLTINCPDLTWTHTNGAWISTYTLDQVGTSYYLKGSVSTSDNQLIDIGGNNGYTIGTMGSNAVTNDVNNQLNWVYWLVGIIITLVVIGTMVYIIFYKGKKRK